MPSHAARLIFRPAVHAETSLITAILEDRYPPGTTLPAERQLAAELGITRPTLREALQRLSRDGWIQIQHGKPTAVLDFWETGGLGILRTLADYDGYLPPDFICHLLEFRIVFLPDAARRAAERRPDAIRAILKKTPSDDAGAEDLAGFDWRLQVGMAAASGNRIYPLLVNDFATIYARLGTRYFDEPRARDASRRFYRALATAVETGPEAVDGAVCDAMEESLDIWKTIASAPDTAGKGAADGIP